MDAILSRQDEAALKKLLSKDKKKKWMQQKFLNGQNALHVACDYGDYASVNLLLKYNADPNEIDNSEQNALHVACKQGTPEIVSLLISHSASVTSKTFQGNTPLHFFIGHKASPEKVTAYFEALEEIKAAGANLNERNAQGETSLHFACLKGAEKNAMWLIRQGSDVNISNNKLETPLHYAARFGSQNLNSILLRAGGLTHKAVSHPSLKGSPRDTARRARRETVVRMFDKYAAYSTSEIETVTINGIDMTIERLQKYKKHYSKAVGESNENSKIRKNSSSIDPNQLHQLLYSIFDINILLLTKSTEDTTAWWGTILMPVDERNRITWKERYCSIDKGKISVYVGTEDNPGDILRTITFTNHLAFEVFCGDSCRFSAIRFACQDRDQFAVRKDTNLFFLLKKLVTCCRIPIEYIDGKPLLSFVDQVEFNSTKATRRDTAPNTPLRSKFTMPSCKRARSEECGLISPRTMDNFPKVFFPNFSSDSFSRVFSNSLSLKKGSFDDEFVLVSGNMRDLLNYSILLCNVEKYEGNEDVPAFYLSYYRYCEPTEIIEKIENLWESHWTTPWPSPFNKNTPCSKLYHFIRGFIESYFVLTDKEEELQFRSDLADLYGRLVPSPMNPNHSMYKLKNLVQKVKKSMEQASISQLCDLTSLLGEIPEGEQIQFDLSGLDVDTVVDQIVCINADLYKQLQISEFLDLRYQKDKKFSVTLNKLHDFSNKIFYLVPTTILQPNDLLQQKAILKKWIVIVEKLFQLRDYNSAIQITNGLTEISIMRLSHLKGSLSPKWIDRFRKIREAFDPAGGYQNYRNLPKDPPCIPFIGVALKDLLFTYEGNPDQYGDGINFNKIRSILEIVRSLKIEEPEQIDYSFLKFDPRVAQALLNVVPLNQDELYQRSIEISDSMVATSDTCEDVPLLRKEIKQLREELHRAKKENERKDKLMAKLKPLHKSSTKYFLHTPSSPLLSCFGEEDLSSSQEYSTSSENIDYTTFDNAELIEMLKQSQLEIKALQSQLHPQINTQ